MTEREQFEDWKATIGPETTSIQDIDDCMWLMAWAAWQARAALEQQAEPDKMTDPVERARYWKLRALAAEGQIKSASLAKKC
jgi:hypothetical protein